MSAGVKGRKGDERLFQRVLSALKTSVSRGVWRRATPGWKRRDLHNYLLPCSSMVFLPADVLLTVPRSVS